MQFKKTYQVTLPEKETEELKGYFKNIGIPLSHFLTRQVIWATKEIKKSGVEKFLAKNFK